MSGIPRWLSILFVTGLLGAPHRLVAQACQGGSPSTCAGFFITELRLAKRLTKVHHGRDMFATMHLGYLASVGERTAIGAAAFAGGDIEGDAWGGAGFRYRRWVGERSSFGLGLGIAPWTTKGLDSPMIHGEAIFYAANWAAVIGQLETISECAYEYQSNESQGFTCKGAKVVPSLGLQLGGGQAWSAGS